MAAKKIKIREEISDFIDNVNSRFRGQRNTLQFMKKIGNADASELIYNSADKEVDFVISRIKLIQSITEDLQPLTQDEEEAVKAFKDSLIAQVSEDITYKDERFAKLRDKISAI